MINHGRTLLLNLDGNKRPEPTFFLEELVPEDYRAVSLNTSLRTVYQTLIGETADNAFANLRVWQYMRILHSTEFESILTDLDPRITYLNDRTLIDQPEVREVAPANLEAGAISGSVLGDAEVSQACPRLDFTWTIQATSPTTVTVTEVKSGTTSSEDVAITEGLTSAIPMVGQSSVRVKLQTPSLPLGAIWTVSLRADPPQDLSDVIGPLSALGDEILFGLFQGGTEEPFKTLKELWDKHYYFQYRLSGLLLAHILRVEELRISGR